MRPVAWVRNLLVVMLASGLLLVSTACNGFDQVLQDDEVAAQLKEAGYRYTDLANLTTDRSRTEGFFTVDAKAGICNVRISRDYEDGPEHPPNFRIIKFENADTGEDIKSKTSIRAADFVKYQFTRGVDCFPRAAIADSLKEYGYQTVSELQVAGGNPDYFRAQVKFKSCVADVGINYTGNGTSENFRILGVNGQNTPELTAKGKVSALELDAFQAGRGGGC
jgi:hypothetical protein